MKLKSFIILLVFAVIATAGAYLAIERPACMFGPDEIDIGSEKVAD